MYFLTKKGNNTIYNIIEQVCVLVQQFEKISATGVASVQTWRSQGIYAKWSSPNEVLQNEVRQMKFCKMKFAKFSFAKK